MLSGKVVLLPSMATALATATAAGGPSRRRPSSVATWMIVLACILAAPLPAAASDNATKEPKDPLPAVPVHDAVLQGPAPHHCHDKPCGAVDADVWRRSARSPDRQQPVRDHHDLHDHEGDASLWPFFRDLDLLRLLEAAASAPASGLPHRDECRRDLDAYLQGLRNFSSWAVQMWDSSVRSPRGALWGELWQMGNFDECLAANDLPASGAGAFCLATLRLQAAPAGHAGHAGASAASAASARQVYQYPRLKGAVPHVCTMPRDRVSVSYSRG
ncbi:uncharacterized protein LOC117650773 [Thrips palmi]|uniref:Uncharacterized protein LOC117650773 n=1 Tax=Thrips palmi TaxID=161013 RepID=A0A6P9A008_THRPL|nr:uncharacterized protein LOC117650773 [Thrips palmi]